MLALVDVYIVAAPVQVHGDSKRGARDSPNELLPELSACVFGVPQYYM